MSKEKKERFEKDYEDYKDKFLTLKKNVLVTVPEFTLANERLFKL